MMSIDALQHSIRKLKNPTMVCLCPYYDQIPSFIRKKASEKFGDTLAGAAEACDVFCRGILDALEGVVPAVSVETACFHTFGAEGIAAMQRVLRYAKEKGYYVLLDAMRCDIAPNAELLAESCFGTVKIGENSFTPYPCDGILLSSYLGSDAVKPFTQFCKEGKNVFLLAHSSNKSAREVQDLLSGDRVVYQVMADLAMRWSGDLFGVNGYSEIGLAVGANNVPVLKNLRTRYDRLFFLVPGFGAQGAGAKDVQYAFDRMGHGAVIMAGRSILYAYLKHDTDEKAYAQVAKQAAEKMREQILGYITVI